MAVTKHSGTLIHVRDPSLDAETRIYYAKRFLHGAGISQMLIAFDQAVYAQGSQDPDEKYRYAIVSTDSLADFAKAGGLAIDSSKRICAGVDRMKGGLIALDLERLQCEA